MSVRPAAVPSCRSRHAFSWLRARERDSLLVVGRRSVLKAALGGASLASVPAILARRAAAAAPGQAARRTKSVILLWMTGGPSHIDTWDVKPEAPLEVRGPFATIPTRIPGVRVCEHLPKQAAMMHRFTLLRAVDARFSNHEPNQVFQTGNLDAEPRTNARGDKYPALASIASREHGARSDGLPAYVVLNLKDRSHVAWGGYLGREHDPFVARDLGRLLELPAGLTTERLRARVSLRRQVDSLRRDLDTNGAFRAMDRFEEQALEMLIGGRAREAFDIAREPEAVRERFGRHEWCQQALLARRLVEAGVSFVTIDLSNHGASGTWDTHGDNIPPYGGIRSGLQPLLPVFDRLITTLVADLEERGLIDDVLVIAMGEFGRTPRIGTQGSTDGRDHWPFVMSAALAGGGLRHGQVIGASSRDGGEVKERPVTPGDLAATIYRHLGVPLDATYLDLNGRPHPVVAGGAPIRELF